MLRPSPEVDADVISGLLLSRGNNGVVVYNLPEVCNFVASIILKNAKGCVIGDDNGLITRNGGRIINSDDNSIAVELNTCDISRI